MDDYLKGKKLKVQFDFIPRILLAYVVQLLILFFHWVIYFNLEHELKEIAKYQKMLHIVIFVIYIYVFFKSGQGF